MKVTAEIMGPIHLIHVAELLLQFARFKWFLILQTYLENISDLPLIQIKIIVHGEAEILFIGMLQVQSISLIVVERFITIW